MISAVLFDTARADALPSRSFVGHRRARAGSARHTSIALALSLVLLAMAAVGCGVPEDDFEARLMSYTKESSLTDSSSSVLAALQDVAADSHFYTKGRTYGGKKISPEMFIIHVSDGSETSLKSMMTDYPQYQLLPSGEKKQTSVSYHFCVADGGILKFVNPDNTAHHCKGDNAKSIGICFVGLPSDMKTYSDENYKAAGALIHVLAEMYGIPIDAEHIVPHRSRESAKAQGKNCPGDKMDMDRLIGLAASSTPGEMPAEPLNDGGTALAANSEEESPKEPTETSSATKPSTNTTSFPTATGDGAPKATTANSAIASSSVTTTSRIEPNASTPSTIDVPSEEDPAVAQQRYDAVVQQLATGRPVTLGNQACVADGCNLLGGDASCRVICADGSAQSIYPSAYLSRAQQSTGAYGTSIGEQYGELWPQGYVYTPAAYAASAWNSYPSSVPTTTQTYVGSNTPIAASATSTSTCIATTEVCDGRDNNCDGIIDDGNPGGGASCSADDVGQCRIGTITCSGGSLHCEPSDPSEEVCDGLDDDCNGQVDDVPGGCNSAAATQSAGGCVPSTEVCNGLDDDCNGQVDDVGAAVQTPCVTLSDTSSLVEGVFQCLQGELQCTPSVPSGMLNPAGADTGGATDSGGSSIIGCGVMRGATTGMETGGLWLVLALLALRRRSRRPAARATGNGAPSSR